MLSPLLSPLQHMTLRVSPYALQNTTEPVRPHKRRRWMSAKYHARIQKKWLKRFGTIKKPCIFQCSPRALGLPGADYFICHPSLEGELRAALVRASAQQCREYGIISVQDACA